MNVSVPDELRKRMDKIDGVNWSAVASDAFRKVVVDHEAKQQQKEINMDRTIERLRASKQETRSQDESLGEEAGIGWAKNSAEAKELERLEESWDATYREWIFLIGEGGAYSSDELFYFIIRPDDDKDRDAAQDFWEEVLGDKDSERTDDFVRGFANGANSVWLKVKREL